MKTLTWELRRGLSWTSRTIGWFGAGYYSHIDVLTPQGCLRGARSDWIMGIPPGYRDRPLNYEKVEAHVRYTLSVSDQQYKDYWNFSNAQLGKPYDSRGLVRAFVFGWPRDRDWRDPSAWWCSEQVARNGEVAGLWSIDPKERNVEPGHCAYLFAGKGAYRQEMPV